MTFQPQFTNPSEWNIFSANTKPLLIAGPCSAETEYQVFRTAQNLKNMGINVYRAGIWKPRTRPNCFEGIGEVGLSWLNRVQNELNMKVATEVANAEHLEKALKHNIDLLWIGARTTVNPFALQEIIDSLSGVDIPILIKNPVNADINVWQGAIERFAYNGIEKLGVIHRGFSSFNSHYRNAPHWEIPIEIKRMFPKITMFCDPSHIGGNRHTVYEISQRAMDLNFDGLIIESHIDPNHALSDAEQQVTPKQLKIILTNLIIRDKAKEDDLLILEELRQRIDLIDSSIIETLSQRMEIVKEIGNYKKQKDITILQANRWDNILQRTIHEGYKYGLSNELINKIFQAIHQEAIEIQNKIMNDGLNEA